jgi:hypothetical protein
MAFVYPLALRRTVGGIDALSTQRYSLRLALATGVSPMPLPKALMKYVTSENPTFEQSPAR